MPIWDQAGVTLALRDVFMATDGAGLARAVSAAAQASGMPVPAGADFATAEYAFNRLFVGPMALEAPPYASVYLEPEPQVMGPTTLSVREVYHSLGMASCLEGSLPDDHAGLELGCAAILRAVCEQAPSPELHAARRAFVAEHMAAWIPAFVERVLTAPSAHSVLTYCAWLLARWLQNETDAVRGVDGAHQPSEET